jgi:histidine ammonia-lyase
MRELLSGYSRDGGEAEGRAGRPVQDPYPFRVLPQVDAVSRGALDALEVVLGRELNARPENALIEEGRAWPNGNFHAAELGAALDALRAALSQSASLIAARISVLLDQRMTGLTLFLAYQPGLDSGAMIVEYVAQAAAAEVRSLATPVAIQSVSASIGIESHASLATTSAKLASQQLEAIRILAACELVVAVRALRMSARAPSGTGSRALFDDAARALPESLEDRTLSPDIEAAGAAIDRWVP